MGDSKNRTNLAFTNNYRCLNQHCDVATLNVNQKWRTRQLATLGAYDDYRSSIANFRNEFLHRVANDCAAPLPALPDR